MSTVRMIAILAVSLAWSVGAARADECTAMKLKAIAKKEAGVLHCHTKVVAKGDTSKLADCLQKVDDSFAKNFAKAGACGGEQDTCECIAEKCATVVRTGLPDVGPSKCEAKRLTAAAKKLTKKLACNVKAAKHGEAVEAKCIQKAEDAFAKAFAKATGCSGDQDGTEAAVDASCVGAVGADAQGGATVGALCVACNVIPKGTQPTTAASMAIAVSGSFVPPPFDNTDVTGFPIPTNGFGSPSGGFLDAPEAAIGTMASRAPGMVTEVLNWLAAAVGPRDASADPVPGFVAVYAPLGDWSSNRTGVALILVGGAFPGTLRPGVVATPDTVNSCSNVAPGTFVAGGANPEAICVANGNDVYLIDGITVVDTLQSAGVSTIRFTGGDCTTCGAVVDPVSNTAVLAVSTSDGYGGYQLLDLANPTQSGLSSVIRSAPHEVSESPAVLSIDTAHFLILSPTEQGEYDIFDVAPPKPPSPGGVIAYHNSQGEEFDAAAPDASGIVYATDEFTGNVFLADLTRVSLTPPAAPGTYGTWSAPSQLQNMPELDFPSAGTSGLAVAYGAGVALLEDEFGSTAFGAVQLPASGAATPAIPDWVVADMPNDPNGDGWRMSLDPHGLVAAFVSGGIEHGGGVAGGHLVPGTGRGIGLLENNARTFVALIDLNGLLAAPRSINPHRVDPTFNLIANDVVAFIPFPGCGDHVVDAGEVCDPPGEQGTCTAGQTCNATCTACETVCGDGLIGPGEVCDPPGEQGTCTAGQSCNGTCTGCETVCGDGLIGPGEVCDPGSGATECATPGDFCVDCTSCAACPVSDTIPDDGGVLTDSTVGGTSVLTGSCAGEGSERIYQWTPSTTHTATIATCGGATNFDTVLYLRQGTCGGADLACNDDSCGLSSSIFPTVTAGETYFIVVDSYSGPGTFTLTVSPGGAFLDD